MFNIFVNCRLSGQCNQTIFMSSNERKAKFSNRIRETVPGAIDSYLSFEVLIIGIGGLVHFLTGKFHMGSHREFCVDL